MMDQKQSNRLSAKHTLAVMLALIGGGLLVWIIQLARQGDPIGYIILTGLGVLASLPVLVLTIHGEEQLAVRVLRAGASGYLTKENAPAELVKAVRKVVSGGKYISSSLAKTLAVATIDRPPQKALSDREFQVMQMMAGGKTLAEIAETLSLRAKTVSTYRTRLLEKMNLTTNAEIIRYAIENGLVE